MSNVHFLKSVPNRVAAPAMTSSRVSIAIPVADDQPAQVEHMPLATFDKLNLTALVVDTRLRVNWASRSAQGALGRMCGALGLRSTLKFGRPDVTDRLAQAVRAACANQAGDVVLPSASGDAPLLVRVLPFGGTRDDGPLALLVVVDPASTDKGESGLVEGRLSALFGLTPMEAKVARRLANGDGMNRVALALGIAVSTARTHAARCYEKTGVRRQAALARLTNGLRLV